MSNQRPRFDPVSISRMILQLIFMAILLFLVAGTIVWPMGWVVVALYASVLLFTIGFVRVDREFLQKRTQIDEMTKGWDKIIAGILRVVSPIGILILAALEVRLGMEWGLSPLVWVSGLLVTITGYGLGIWAVSANPFYAGFARIDQDHSVVGAGPYAYIRHPGYAGSILVQLGLPIMLRSQWAFLLGVLGVVLVVVRTHFEDRVLREELSGYERYAERVVFRLVPGIY